MPHQAEAATRDPHDPQVMFEAWRASENPRRVAFQQAVEKVNDLLGESDQLIQRLVKAREVEVGVPA
jgi:hypothetical protein